MARVSTSIYIYTNHHFSKECSFSINCECSKVGPCENTLANKQSFSTKHITWHTSTIKFSNLKKQKKVSDESEKMQPNPRNKIRATPLDEYWAPATVDTKCRDGPPRGRPRQTASRLSRRMPLHLPEAATWDSPYRFEWNPTHCNRNRNCAVQSAAGPPSPFSTSTRAFRPSISALFHYWFSTL